MVKLFISHSTSSDKRTARLRDGIADGLKGREYDVLLDVRIRRPSRPWQLKLACFLGECDAALVLVNKAALTSDWVRRETNILHWRKTLNPAMVLVTVLVGAVSPEELRNSEIGYLAEDDLEKIGPGGSAGSAAEVGRLVAMFPKVLRAGNDAVSSWLRNIAIQLSEIKHESTFAEIAQELEIPAEEHTELVPGMAPVLLASQMLDTHDIAKLLKTLLAALDGGLEPRRTALLATMVFPAWVDRDEARRIVRDTDGSVRRVIILNVDSPLIGQQYLDRAFCVNSRSYYIAQAVGRPLGEDDPESYLLHQCEGAVKAALGLEPHDELGALKEPAGFGRFFLLLDAKRCDLRIVHRVIAQLHEKVPWMQVLVIPGRGANARERWPGSPDEVLVLDPPFEASHENVVKSAVLRVADKVGTVNGRSW
ncbi:toll/interleukin-1 receptor domain-containing protein [Streptomyces sp. CA-111067]|uniref:toll/interleukin-1 receptor domain-containing protein n=1 Tax=Streptomyces sp. CA-111067 TaxID=3240046 RepID=UPI003D97BA69